MPWHSLYVHGTDEDVFKAVNSDRCDYVRRLLNPINREVPRPPVGEDGIVRLHACALSLHSNKGIVSRNREGSGHLWSGSITLLYDLFQL
jgi:hypothetical protein